MTRVNGLIKSVCSVEKAIRLHGQGKGINTTPRSATALR